MVGRNGTHKPKGRTSFPPSETIGMQPAATASKIRRLDMVSPRGQKQNLEKEEEEDWRSEWVSEAPPTNTSLDVCVRVRNKSRTWTRWKCVEALQINTSLDVCIRVRNKSRTGRRWKRVKHNEYKSWCMRTSTKQKQNQKKEDGSEWNRTNTSLDVQQYTNTMSCWVQRLLYCTVELIDLNKIPLSHSLFIYIYIYLTQYFRI